MEKNNMIHLEKIDSTNIWEIVDLKVFKSQKSFVAANWVSIVQAYGVRDSATAAFPFAIYHDKRPVVEAGHDAHPFPERLPHL